MGGRRKHLLPEHYPMVEQWASQGVTEASMYHALGLSKHHWQEARKADAKLRAALESGRAQEHDALVGALFRAATHATKPHVVAGIFLLKARHGYIDQPQPKAEASRVRVEVVLPRALTPEQYQKVLDVTPRKALQRTGVKSDSGEME